MTTKMLSELLQLILTSGKFPIVREIRPVFEDVDKYDDLDSEVVGMLVVFESHDDRSALIISDARLTMEIDQN